MSGTKIKVGMTFHYDLADGRPKWRVEKARGDDTWECRVTEDSDYTGTRRVFGGEDIRSAMQADALWRNLASEHDDFWNAQPVGATVHYSYGFGCFVRGVIVIDPTTEEKHMLPTALVGKWRKHELPHMDAEGNLRESSHAKQIRRGETMQPNYTNMVEAVGVRNGETDPRGREAIDLTPPAPTPDQVEAARLCTIRDHVRGMLEIEPGGDYGLRQALLGVRAYLDRANI